MLLLLSLQVLDVELQLMRQALVNAAEPGAGYNPPITVVAVQKNHNKRFFGEVADNTGSSASASASTKLVNVCPGTVVDRDVVHPTQFEFYLNSHAAIQGTCKPTNYRPLYDENGFSSDSLQLMLYYHCYLYQRATRAVSLPAPVFYAVSVLDCC